MNSVVQQVHAIRLLLIAVVAVATMFFAAEVLQPVAMAILLAFILEPLIEWFMRRGLPRVAAVILTLLATFALVGGIGYVVGQQIVAVASKMPEYEDNLISKLAVLQPSGESVVDQVSSVAEHVQDEMAKGDVGPQSVPVRITQESKPFGRLTSYLGPFQHGVALGAVVLLLLLFLLLQGDETQDRIAQLVGRNQISTATKTLGQIGRRLSRYLSTFALFNALFGTVVGVGLFAIGLPNALLWGVLAGLLRFIPYVGPATAVALPTLFALAESPGWREPLLVLGFFGVCEAIANTVEPIVYGKSTGVSSLSLLVAALFWTWLWGPLGLLLSTPLTVCLAVIGRSIPSLGFLGTLLGDEVEVDEELRWFQRALSRDQEGAVALLDAALLTHRPLGRFFDQIILPALSRAAQDRASGALEQRDLAFIWRVVQEWTDDLALRDDLPRLVAGVAPDQEWHAPVSIETSDDKSRLVVGVATEGVEDRLILRLLDLLLEDSGIRLSLIDGLSSPLIVTDQIVEQDPALVLISHLPPVGLPRARYLVKRTRARMADVPMMVAYWDAQSDRVAAVAQLQVPASTKVVTSLVAARQAILDQFNATDDDPSDLTPKHPAQSEVPALAGR